MKKVNIRGTQTVKPFEIEVNVDTVYVRTNIIRIETEEFIGWQYDEEQYSIREYQEFISVQTTDLKTRQDATEDALLGFLLGGM